MAGEGGLLVLKGPGQSLCWTPRTDMAYIMDDLSDHHIEASQGSVDGQRSLVDKGGRGENSWSWITGGSYKRQGLRYIWRRREGLNPK